MNTTLAFYIIMTGSIAHPHDDVDNKSTVLWQRGDSPPPVPLFYSDNLRLGYIDTNGNFVPSRNNQLRTLVNHIRPQPINTVFNYHPGGPYHAYEYRSGTRISGFLLTSKFIPDVGTTITKNTHDMSQHPYSKDDKYLIPMTRNEYSPTKVPYDTKEPAGWTLFPFDKADTVTFSSSGRPWHVRVIADVAEYGHLAPDGEFIPDYGLPVMPRSAVPEPANCYLFPDSKWYYAYTLPRNDAKTEPVYEFRSGRLIKGTLHDTGNFAPEIGSTILDFKDYDPESTRRIYNLPGVLRKIEKP